METNNPKVFISYSHQNEAYEKQMLEFANRLRSDGIDAEIDLYNPVPPEGWQRWMENQIVRSDYTIVVCGESYWEKCYNDHAKGITWEVNMVYQMLYDQKGSNTKFIPVFWNDGDERFILTPLRPYTYYNIGTQEGYEGLWRHILNIPKYKKPELGEIREDKYEALPPKSQRTMFFSTPIDIEKWDKARWKGMIYLLSPTSPPILGFLFRDYDAGKKIFSQWQKNYENTSADDYLSITYIVPPLPQNCYVYSDPKNNYGKGYFVYVGVNEDKAIKRAIEFGNKPDEILLTFISRYIWVYEMTGSHNRETFLKQVQLMKEFTVIPMGLIDETKPFTEKNLHFGYEYGIKLHNVLCKRGIDIGENDSCKVVLEKAEDD